jgi:hypothetical protein
MTAVLHVLMLGIALGMLTPAHADEVPYVTTPTAVVAFRRRRRTCGFAGGPWRVADASAATACPSISTGRHGSPVRHRCTLPCGSVRAASRERRWMAGNASSCGRGGWLINVSKKQSRHDVEDRADPNRPAEAEP